MCRAGDTLCELYTGLEVGENRTHCRNEKKFDVFDVKLGRQSIPDREGSL